MMKFLSNILLLITTCIALSACTSITSTSSRNEQADAIATSHGFARKLVKGGEFWITTFQRITNKQSPYVFYIEGDGLFYIGKQISDDPTPIHPMLLELASMDWRPNVVYIARPCQYTLMHLNPQCNYAYWTDKRMSEEAVGSINEVIEITNDNKPFSLVGYSGGGGIAVLIAARNKNVKNIITIAGNLDHVSFNEYHKTKKMLGSLNPIDYVSYVRNIPQLHATGGSDIVVPPFIADNFVRASNSPYVHQKIYTGIEHRKGWEKVWPDILNELHEVPKPKD